MLKPLPQSSEAFEALHWAEIEPWYRELAETTLTSDTLEPWLRQWSRLSALVDETNTRLEVAITRDIADETLSRRRQRFLDEIFTHVQHIDQQIKQHLLGSGLSMEGFALCLRKLQADALLFRAENVSLLNEEKQLVQAYMSIKGAQTVQWEGKEIPIVLLYPQMQNPDRKLRQQAWCTFNERKLEDRETLFKLWIKGLQVRQQMTRNAGHDNYREYRWQQLYRFDYIPDDCQAFHEAVQQVVVPVASQLAQKRRKLLGVERLRPWDAAAGPWSVAVDSRSRHAPRAIEDIDVLLPALANLFRQIDPALGDYFDTMLKEQCFDLEARANKASGGYNAPLEVKQLPFIFGSVMTIQDVVWLLFHEVGHAFHTFEVRGLPYFHQRSMLPMEFAEVASTSMEFIASMHLSSCGLCSKEEARCLRLQQMEGALLSLPMIIRGDAFQHWVYENPEQARDLEAVERKWAELGRRFEPDPDWSEWEVANRNSWHNGIFFEAPFYYIEYAFALIGALQIWRNYLRDPQGTIQQYRQALSFGATRPLSELYTVAGAQFAFDMTTLQEIVQFVTNEIQKLEQEMDESQANID